MLRFTLIKYIDKLLYNDEKIFPVLFEHYILKVHPMLYRYRLFHRMTDNASEDELGCYVNKNVFFPEQTQILSHLFKMELGESNNLPSYGDRKSTSQT